ncbi:MAG: TIGR04255 family protein, partial [Oscillospiraceae bacterium]|nr:TIGR04255 family protein [Oscillospiraceae bacterium]
MFSTKDRCHYRSNQIAEVICQLRFPEILSIGTTAPAAFQDAIRDEFPQFIRRQDLPAPKITG